MRLSQKPLKPHIYITYKVYENSIRFTFKQFVI